VLEEHLSAATARCERSPVASGHADGSELPVGARDERGDETALRAQGEPERRVLDVARRHDLAVLGEPRGAYVESRVRRVCARRDTVRGGTQRVPVDGLLDRHPVGHQARHYTSTFVTLSEHAPCAIGDEVREAVAAGRPVVALETTLLVHGLPQDEAAGVGEELEAAVRAGGAVPATVGMIDGVAVIGLASAEVRRLIERRDHVVKLSTRDLGFAAAARRDGATTVAATISLAAAVGVKVMATGGIGGVHLGAKETFDESSDLVALSRTECLVVASGVKSILDVPATLERLDTLGVPVAGFRTDRFPGFYVRDSGCAVTWMVATPAEAAAAFLNHVSFGGHGMLLANPVPEQSEMDPAVHAQVLADGLHEVVEAGISGADVTPYLLAHFAEKTEGMSVSSNVALVLDNAQVAAQVAVAIATGVLGN
jgi:pseudouridylate synthase